MKEKTLKFIDGFALAWMGIKLCIKKWQFWVLFILILIFFGTLLNMLTAGFASFSLMFSMGFPAGLSILIDAMLGTFGIGKNFIDWILVFSVAALQALLIAMIIITAKLKKKDTSESLERAGIAAGLALLGSGCPTCGTALLAPILGAVFAGGSAMVGTISGIITGIAILVLIFSIRKVGEEYYVIMESNRYKAKKRAEEKDEKVE